MTSARRTRRAEDRLRRLLVMLPWLMEQRSVPLADVAARFGLTEDEVATDLELVAMCGLPPYVDELIDVFIDEGRVEIGVPRLFTRPLRLNSVEAFELLVAARAAMELPGADPSGPLGRGLAKLAAAVDETASIDEHVTVDLERTDVADRAADAARRLERVRVRYWSASRDETSDRVIVPLRVFADRGNWYVTAYDERAEALRTFRLDRVEHWEPTGACSDPLDLELPEPGTWFSDASVARLELLLDDAARWVVERYPVDSVGEPDTGGWIPVVLPLVSTRWAERLVIRLGPHVQVVAPAEVRDSARAMARQMLDRYRDQAGAPPAGEPT